jgi:hypothetical protein
VARYCMKPSDESSLDNRDCSSEITTDGQLDLGSQVLSYHSRPSSLGVKNA